MGGHVLEMIGVQGASSDSETWTEGAEKCSVVSTSTISSLTLTVSCEPGDLDEFCFKESRASFRS